MRQQRSTVLKTLHWMNSVKRHASLKLCMQFVLWHQHESVTFSPKIRTRGHSPERANRGCGPTSWTLSSSRRWSEIWRRRPWRRRRRRRRRCQPFSICSRPRKKQQLVVGATGLARLLMLIDINATAEPASRLSPSLYVCLSVPLSSWLFVCLYLSLCLCACVSMPHSAFLIMFLLSQTICLSVCVLCLILSYLPISLLLSRPCLRLFFTPSLFFLSIFFLCLLFYTRPEIQTQSRCTLL